MTFFIVYFGWTQKIYSKNHIKILIALCIIFPTAQFLFITNPNSRIKAVSFALISLYYSLLLLTIKFIYKKIIFFLINKNWIDKSFANKDYTYVFQDGEILTDEWWDESLASKPSWFDTLITYSLLIIPLALIAPVYEILKVILL